MASGWSRLSYSEAAWNASPDAIFAIIGVQANADINVTGLEATGETERVNVWGITPPTQQNPNWTEIAA